MMLIYIFLIATLVIIPVFKSLESNKEKIYKSRSRDMQLSWVQRHYPELKDLSWNQIERHYPVTELFDKIR